MTLNRIPILAIVACMFLPVTVSAGIVAIADGSGTPGPIVGPTHSDAAGSQAATARVTSYHVNGTSFANEGYSSTVFGDPKCLFCGQSMDARVSADGTGTVKLFTGVGMTPGTQGIAEARVDLDDIIEINSPLSIGLDTFFSQLDRGPSVLFAPYGTHAVFQMGLSLSDVNDPANSYSVEFDAAKSYQNGFPHIDTEFWKIQEAVGGGGWVTIAGTSQIGDTNGHFEFSRTLTLSPGSWNLTFFAFAGAFCSGGAPMTCPAIFDSSSTSYLGIQGGFTSQNGYQYTGFTGAPAEVPEPQTLSLLFPIAAGFLLLWRFPRFAQPAPKPISKNHRPARVDPDIVVPCRKRFGCRSAW